MLLGATPSHEVNPKIDSAETWLSQVLTYHATSLQYERRHVGSVRPTMTSSVPTSDPNLKAGGSVDSVHAVQVEASDDLWAQVAR